MKRLILGSAILALSPAAPAWAQPQAQPVAAVNGVRLDVVATGEVTRTPDIVTISAGVTTRAPQAEAALRDNAARMDRVRAALRRLGIEPRDIQTGSISLSQEYQHSPDGQARPNGYTAGNQLTIRFRDVARAGPIIDALVAEGVNNVNGPGFDIENRQAAIDEARTRAIAVAQARAELYARALNTRVRRILAVSEVGEGRSAYVGNAVLQAQARDSATAIEPGEQMVGATVTVTFELEQPGR